MKAYKIKTTINPLLEQGRLFFEVPNTGELLLIATPTEPQAFYSHYSFRNLQSQGMLDEVDLMNETKIHPHLYKPIKKLLVEEKFGIKK